LPDDQGIRQGVNLLETKAQKDREKELKDDLPGGDPLVRSTVPKIFFSAFIALTLYAGKGVSTPLARMKPLRLVLPERTVEIAG
jgi:hypothetical protein